MPDPGSPEIGLAAFYNTIFAGRGFSLAPHHYPIVAGLQDKRIGNLLILAAPGTGKSSLLCTIYPAWLLGQDPAHTVLSVSAGEKLPQTFMQSVMQIVQHSKSFQRLFPAVRPAQDMGWSMQRGLFVTGHHPEDENASYMSAGLQSKALTGLHCRTMIMDDIHDRENSMTAEGRANVRATYYDTLMGRADPRGIRRIAAGRWWAPDDLYQEWIASGDWVVLELPAVRAGQKRLWYDVYVPKGVECVYSERLPLDPVQDRGALYTRYRAYYAAADELGEGFYWPGSPSKRTEYRTIARRQPHVAAVNYRGDMTGGGDAVFNPDDFRPYLPPEGLAYGIAHAGVRQWVIGLKGIVEDAWDTALGQPQSESKTAALTGLMVPSKSWHTAGDAALGSECDFHYVVYLLDLYVGSPDFGALVRTMRERFGLWHPRRLNIEEKQSGVSLLQVARGMHLPVYPIKVVEGKLERAINPVLMDALPIGGGAASVQGWARMGRIMVPAGAPWVEDFLERVCSFHGGTRNTDEFDALVHLVTRAILMSRRTGRFGSVDTATATGDPLLAGDGRRAVLDGFGMLGRQQASPAAMGVENPMSGFCGAPCHWWGVENNTQWCGRHQRASVAFAGCGDWAARGTVSHTVLERLAAEQEQETETDD